MNRYVMLVLLSVLGGTGCDQKNPVPGAPGSARPTPRASAVASAEPASSAPSKFDVLDRPRSSPELRTTDAKIYLGNLDAQIEAGRKALAANPDIPARYTLLASRILTRAKFRGDLAAMAEAEKVASDGLAKTPKERALLLVRADARQALHRFHAAATDATAAHAISQDDKSRALLADLAWNQGRYDQAIADIRQLATKKPTFSSLVRLAQLEADLGNVPAAKRAFGRAETQIKVVSPLPLAWLNVQRGLLRLHTGDFAGAKPFYAEAVERMPTYPMALEHLAEIEHLLGSSKRASDLYERTLKASDDPEFLTALSGVLADAGNAARARELVEKARRSYDDLLKLYPEAMYWHAADFYANEGASPKTAVELLRKNAKIRPTATSLAALAGAELAVGNIVVAAKTIDRALESPVKRAEIYWTAAKIRASQKNDADAKHFATKAKELNPKIETLEGPLAD